MKKQKRFIFVSLILAALALPMSWAGASVILQFNNNPNNVVGGSPETIQVTPGANIVISLQLVSTTETTTSLDYWLAQFSGPGSGVFSLTARDFTGSDFNRPLWNDTLVINPVDNFSNSQVSGLGHPDGIADNLLAPRNGPDLGARDTALPNPPGTHQVFTFTLTISLGAVLGLYQIRTYDYPGNGWADENFNDHDFDGQAAINIQVVPEPSTWLLLGFTALVVVGGKVFRAAKLDRG